MDKVTINKDEFLIAVRANLEAHRDEFEKAITGYRKVMHRELERRIEDLEAGRSIERTIRFVEPEDHSSDYEQVIRMAEMSVDETVELSSHDFACYIMDDWGWKQQWTLSNSQYTS